MKYPFCQNEQTLQRRILLWLRVWNSTISCQCPEVCLIKSCISWLECLIIKFLYSDQQRNPTIFENIYTYTKVNPIYLMKYPLRCCFWRQSFVSIVVWIFCQGSLYDYFNQMNKKLDPKIWRRIFIKFNTAMYSNFLIILWYLLCVLMLISLKMHIIHWSVSLYTLGESSAKN